MNRGESKSESKRLPWRELYTIAILETDPALSRQRVAEAEWAVTLRLDELGLCSDGEEERLALIRTQDALDALRNSPPGAVKHA
jgi:hypothetical protein